MATQLLPPQVIEEACEWAIMHGVAFRQGDNSARHCPFSFAPMVMEKKAFAHLQFVTPLIAKLVDAVSEDADFLQQQLAPMAQADAFFGRLMGLHLQIHGSAAQRARGEVIQPLRQPLLLMRTDYMDDRQQGAKVIEFNGIAAGMAPFGQRASELHRFLQRQWPVEFTRWSAASQGELVNNAGIDQLAKAIEQAARRIQADFAFQEPQQGAPTFVMVVQANEDNVYDQHLLELALQARGVRTVRRTFAQLHHTLLSGENGRLLLDGIGAVDVVYLRAGYQCQDYWLDDEKECCHTLGQTRRMIEQHRVALNATLGQQLATSKTMQMVLTMMPAQAYLQWGLTIEEANAVKTVLAEMKPLNPETIAWFFDHAQQKDWVLKNQGEGGGHCVFGSAIGEKLASLHENEYNAWLLMQRLYPHERDTPALAIRQAAATQVDDLVSEIGLFTAFYQGEPMTDYAGYAGYLIRSKPASENEGGIHSGQGILDSLMVV
ncbi:glutathione synthase [Vibrio sp. SM6]|uniref:glutathione synthase n=1 Tax=Vibrio agarilyticus TaxID=2726741 RepID=A0A7X8TN92_9VIBR|nr:glutathione synthase [Vibrio agarilyticus]NLS11868.1 glutathione synthase [Vibrio agarilyticus]